MSLITITDSDGNRSPTPVGIDRPSSELSGAGQPASRATLRAFEKVYAGQQEVVRAQDSRVPAAALRRRVERPRDRSQPACVAVDRRRLRASRRGRRPGLASARVRRRRGAGATAVLEAAAERHFASASGLGRRPPGAAAQGRDALAAVARGQGDPTRKDCSTAASESSTAPGRASSTS